VSSKLNDQTSNYEICYLRGKGLGGSSLSETFIADNEDLLKHEVSFDERYHGSSGPVKRTIPRSIADQEFLWMESCKAHGLDYNSDTTKGENRGIALHTKTVDERSVRVSAASAYYEHNQERPNLQVIFDAYATRIMTSTAEDGKITATGVEYLLGGTTQVIQATKEVIICCGAFKTPQILELSGIGDPRTGYRSYESLDDPTFAKEQEENLYGAVTVQRSLVVLLISKTNGTGSLTSAAIPSIAAFLSLKDFDDDGTISKTIELERSFHSKNPTLEIQRQWALNENVPFLELSAVDVFRPGTVTAPEPGATYQTFAAILLHSFDRGSVHIKSTDPTAPPAIDLNIINNETDIQIFVKAYKLLRMINNTEPFKGSVEDEISPGETIITDDQIIDYVKKTVSTSFHPIGTASMLPRELGGCVDHELKVYGTRNLRVVDASIISVHISAHLQSTLYAFAEKAADIIIGCK
ncbi:hypothetical protein H0H93_005483, partial [Arthromyces matolae]